MNVAISAQQLSVHFGERTALERITFELPIGAYLAIIGPNGSGKSTLVKTMLGLIKPTSGKIDTSGVGSVGYVPQIKTLDRTFPATAVDLVVSGMLRTWPFRIGRSLEAEALDILKRINAEELARKPLSRLSGGELQRVYLARAISRKPDLLVLDEPASGIDLSGEESIHRTIEAARGESYATVAIVTHDLSIAFHHATHALILNSVQLGFGPVSEVLTDDILRSTFGHAGHTHSMRMGVQ